MGRPGPEDPRFVATDEAGRFRFAGVPLSNFGYEVTARYPGFMQPRHSIASATPADRSMPVRIELQRYAAIVGKITDSSGVPLGGIMVEVLQRYPQDEQHPGAIREGDWQYMRVRGMGTNDLGEYRMAPLVPGSYYVVIRSGWSSAPARDRRERDTYYPHALKLSDAKPLDIDEGKEARADVQMIRLNGAKVSGRTLGAAAGHVLVSAFPLSPGASQKSADAPDGRFELADLAPGKYTITASLYDADDLSYREPLAAGQQMVEVGGEDVTGVELTLAPTPDLEGSVVFESGCPAVPVEIQAQGKPAGRLDVRSDAGGRFVLKHVLPGKWRVFATADIATSGAHPISARLGDTEVLQAEFDVSTDTAGPLRITMGCSWR